MTAVEMLELIWDALTLQQCHFPCPNELKCSLIDVNLSHDDKVKTAYVIHPAEAS